MNQKTTTLQLSEAPDQASDGSSLTTRLPTGLPPGSLAALHENVGAVLVDDEGRLANATAAAFHLLSLGEADVGCQVGPHLAAIAIRHVFGPENGVTPSPDEVDDRVRAFCLPMGLHGATLYLLWRE